MTSKVDRDSTKSHHIILNAITANEQPTTAVDENSNCDQMTNLKSNANLTDESESMEATLIESKENAIKAKKKRSKSERLRRKKKDCNRRRASLDVEQDKKVLYHRLLNLTDRPNKSKEQQAKSRLECEISAVFMYNGIEYCSRGCNTDKEYNPLEEFDFNDDIELDEELNGDSEPTNESIEKELADNFEKLFNFKLPNNVSNSNNANRTEAQVDDEIGNESEDELLRKLMLNTRMNRMHRNHSGGLTRLKTILVIFVLFFVAKWFSKNDS